jgi:hypothetical protein
MCRIEMFNPGEIYHNLSKRRKVKAKENNGHFA